MVTTIHGFPSERILPMYVEYRDVVYYVAITDADRYPNLRYVATIHHGIPIDDFPFNPSGSDDLLFFGRIHPDKGVAEAIAAARRSENHLHMYGIVQDRKYYLREVLPAEDGVAVTYHSAVVGRSGYAPLAVHACFCTSSIFKSHSGFLLSKRWLAARPTSPRGAARCSS